MGTRTLVLVRHGQYHKATDKELERLTTLGRKQAVLAARRLKEYKIDRIVHSTMPRAIETASIIKSQLRFKKNNESCPSLCECVPGFPKKLRKKFGFTDLNILARHQRQADRAFKKYFRSSVRNRVDVLVCHGNIIRYLICKSLSVDTSAWKSMDIQQCGISVVEIHSKGHFKKVVISHNDVGHIPKEMRTYL